MKKQLKNFLRTGILFLILSLPILSSKLYANTEMAAAPDQTQQPVVEALADPETINAAAPVHAPVPVRIPELQDMDAPLSNAEAIPAAAPVKTASAEQVPAAYNESVSASVFLSGNAEEQVDSEADNPALETAQVFVSLEDEEDDPAYEKIDIAKKIQELKDILAQTEDEETKKQIQISINDLQSAYDDGLREVVILLGGIKISYYTDGWAYSFQGIFVSYRSGNYLAQFQLVENNFLIWKNGGIEILSNNAPVFNFNFSDIIPFLTDPFKNFQQGLSDGFKNLFGGS